MQQFYGLPLCITLLTTYIIIIVQLGEEKEVTVPFPMKTTMTRKNSNTMITRT